MARIFKGRYKAIFCDVDGTLIGNSHNAKVSIKVRESISKAKKRVTVGIASGRTLDGVKFLFKDLGLQKPCIINGGAQIVHPISRKILWERPILTKDLRSITSAINNLPHKIFVVNNGREFIYHQNLSIKKPISFFIPKIQEKKADIIIRELSRYHTLSLNKVVAYRKGWIALHITHAQATKKYAAIKLAEILKIKKADIIGIGDGYNDYPLFNACGLRVAIGNAVPGLKKMADYIAPTVTYDGVADVIDRFVLPSGSRDSNTRLDN